MTQSGLVAGCSAADPLAPDSPTAGIARLEGANRLAARRIGGNVCNPFTCLDLILIYNSDSWQA
jgi:hypothetical protein